MTERDNGWSGASRFTSWPFEFRFPALARIVAECLATVDRATLTQGDRGTDPPLTLPGEASDGHLQLTGHRVPTLFASSRLGD